MSAGSVARITCVYSSVQVTRLINILVYTVMEDVISIILGGGAGSRLSPLTAFRSKPAVPLAGKYRLIDIPVSNCINSDINRIFVLTQYNSASLNRHIANTYRFDRFSAGFVTILAAEQTPNSTAWFQGTADAVRRSMTHVQNFRHKHVLILSGDQLYLMDYRKMLAHHLAHGADITVGSVPVTAADAPGFGILRTNDNEEITEFYEKPSADQLAGKESPVSADLEEQGKIYLASMGIYIFSSRVLQEALDARPGDHDFGKQIIPRAIENYKVVSYPFKGYWSDIGTIGSFYEANLDLTTTKPKFNLYDEHMPLYTNARMLPPAKIHASYIQDSLIAEASIIISAHVSNSVIGIRSYIGRNATIKNTVMMGADYHYWHDPELRSPVKGPNNPGIEEESYLEGVIIDKNVSIGKRCVIKNRDQIMEGEGPGFYIRDRIVVIPKNTRIPDDTII